MMRMGWILVRECARAARAGTGTVGSYRLPPPRVVAEPDFGTTSVVLTDYYSGRAQNVPVPAPPPPPYLSKCAQPRIALIL